MTATRSRAARGRRTWLLALPTLLILPILCGVTCDRQPSYPGMPDRNVALRRGPAWLDPAIEGAGGRDWIRVAVEHRAQADLRALARSLHGAHASRRQAREATLRHLDGVAGAGRSASLGRLVRKLADAELARDPRWVRIRSAVVLTVHRDALPAIAADPDVGRVLAGDEADVREGASARRSAPDGTTPIPPGPSWAVEALGLEELWSAGIDGRGVVVGILDSGVQGDHAALSGANAPGPSWFDPSGEFAEPVDTVPHGTHVLAAAVGRPVDGRAIGAAPGARWAAARSNIDNHYAFADMLVAADWILFEAGPDVIVAPWGHGPGSCDDRDLPLIEAFRVAGTLPVFAAGNGGPEARTGQAPAALSNLSPDGRGPISAGAIDRNLRLLPESARGPRVCGSPQEPFPHVVAPGWLVPVPGSGREELGLSSGTSLAAGFTAGVLALAMQVASNTSVPDLEDLLRETARDLPPDGRDADSGYGLIDPAALVEAAARGRARRR